MRTCGARCWTHQVSPPHSYGHLPFYPLPSSGPPSPPAPTSCRGALRSLAGRLACISATIKCLISSSPGFPLTLSVCLALNQTCPCRRPSESSKSSHAVEPVAHRSRSHFPDAAGRCVCPRPETLATLSIRLARRWQVGQVVLAEPALYLMREQMKLRHDKLQRPCQEALRPIVYHLEIRVDGFNAQDQVSRPLANDFFTKEGERGG